MILALSVAGIVIAIVPTGMFLANLSLFDSLTNGPSHDPKVRRQVSVLLIT